MPTEKNDAMSYSYKADDGIDQTIAAQCLEAAESIQHTTGSYLSTDYPVNPAGRVHTRVEMTPIDYAMHRPHEAVPKKTKEAIIVCDDMYHRIGLLRNVIDLMSDFASQGIEVFHPVKSKERRYRHWFRKVQGKERSERFLNLLYRQGNVVIKRAFGDLNAGDLDDLDHGIAGRVPNIPADMEYQRHPKYFRNRIPLIYTFLNPTSIELIGGDLAMFASMAGNKREYGLKVPQALITLIKNPKNVEEKGLVGQLPDWVVQSVRAGKKLIPLDTEKLEVFHYKKDDWQQWAHPMTYSILSDLRLLEKHKLADMAALDGAISHIRLWRLGLPEHRIQPGPAAFRKLAEQLRNNVGGGSMDLIWDASLDLKETSTDVYRFLGSEKYQPTLQAIYAGLGIPQSLTGSGQTQGMTNNSLSLKTLIERLQYGRDLLTEFWEKEMHILQEAFGDKQPARIHFDNMSMSDEAAEKMLWVQLYDRDIISIESIREKFGQIPEVEESRINREYKQRKVDTVPEKLGPFVEVGPNPDSTAQKAMQVGLVAPSEVKMKKQPKKPGDKTLLDHQKEMQQDQIDAQKEIDQQKLKLEEKKTNQDIKQNNDLHQQTIQQKDLEHKQKLQHKDNEHKALLPIKKQALKRSIKSKGQPGQGRPGGSKDTTPRKKRTPKPRTAATLYGIQVWARAAQKAIADSVHPLYLNEKGKKSLRSLTTEQGDELERIKASILFSIDPASVVKKDDIESRYSELKETGYNFDGQSVVDELVDEVYASRNKEPNTDELRDVYVTAYALIHSEIDGDEDGETHNDAGHGDAGDVG